MSVITRLKKVIFEIRSRYQYLRGDKGIIEKPYRNLKNWQPEKTIGKIGRGAGLGGIDLSWFLFCLAKYTAKDLNTIFFDNQIIDKLKEKKEQTQINNSDSKFKQFFKRLNKSYPKTAARLNLWMLYTLMVFLTIGGVKVSQYRGKTSKDKKETKEIKQENRNSIDNLKIDPTLSKADWDLQMEAIWPYLYMETVLSEGFVDEAYADVGDTDGYLTIGSGFMIGKANPRGPKDNAIIQERKAFFKEVLGKPYVNGVKISYEENRILIRKFYEKYVWPFVKSRFTEPMDAHLFIELCIGNFNRGCGIYNDKSAGKNIKRAVNEGQDILSIVNNFDDLCKNGFDGLRPKYGVAAHRVLGNISDEDVLNSLANSVYGLNANKIWSKGTLIQYDSIASDLRNVNNANVKKNGKTYVQHRVKDYLTPAEVRDIEAGNLFALSWDYLQPVVQQTETTAEQLNEQGEALYNANDYKGAIAKYHAALEQNPKLYIVYSNLCLAYYRSGDYEKAVEIVEDFKNSEYFDFAPVTVKGYTYYNIALSYEKLGDNAKNSTQKLEYYNLAKANLDLGEKVANTKYYTLDGRIKKKLDKLMNKKSKTAMFNAGVEKINDMKKQSNIMITQFNDKDFMA